MANWQKIETRTLAKMEVAMAVPALNLRAVPRPPAGMPTSHTSKSARLKRYIEAQQSSIFGPPERPRESARVALSHRERLKVNADRKKYTTWLTRWDRDPGVGRFLMLSEFVKKCQGMSRAQLDETFGNSAELVFIHMYAFLRLNYGRACSIGLQLEALRIFFEASSGYCFAYSFLSSGGSLLLLELVKMIDNLSDEDLIGVLETFLSLTEHGPRAQRLLTETKIAEVFVNALPKLRNDQMHRMVVMLFAQISEGDEEHAELFCNAFRAEFVAYARENVAALTTAAHIFRILFTPKIASECDIKNSISDFLVLTTCESLEVQREAIAIFQTILDNTSPARRKFLLDVVIDLINVNTDEVPSDLLEQKLLQQTFAVRLVQAIVQNKNATSDALYEMIQQVLPALVRAIGNKENFAGQKSACLVLADMVCVWPETRTNLTNAMPNEWVNELLKSPQQFCLQLTPTQVDTLQGAEAEHLFFDAEETEEKRPRRKAESQLELGDLKTTQIAGSIYAAPPLIKRPSVLKFIPSSKPAVPKTPVVSTRSDVC